MKQIFFFLCLLTADLSVHAQTDTTKKPKPHLSLSKDSSYNAVLITDSLNNKWLVRYSFVLKDSTQAKDSSGKTIYVYKSHAQILKFTNNDFVTASKEFVVTYHRERNPEFIARRDFQYAIKHNLITLQ